MTRRRGGTCFKPTTKPRDTLFPSGTRFGDFAIVRRVGYRGDLYEAKCVRCNALSNFSFQTLTASPRIACPCTKKPKQEDKTYAE